MTSVDLGERCLFVISVFEIRIDNATLCDPSRKVKHNRCANNQTRTKTTSAASQQMIVDLNAHVNKIKMNSEIID